MAKDSKQAGGKERYSEVVTRLQAVVDELEGGKLSLEDSLEKFAEGVKLVKKGEQLLDEAEKRIEQLLSEDGQTRPLEEAGAEDPAASPKGAQKPEDVPF
ncbi:MAG: exodeoxyribonuclease VII small subunit [Myxococcales bacterium]|nr:exodeoxyribonuclease VII small subunit [Myxococcales bacterium]